MAKYVNIKYRMGSLVSPSGMTIVIIAGKKITAKTFMLARNLVLFDMFDTNLRKDT